MQVFFILICSFVSIIKKFPQKPCIYAQPYWLTETTLHKIVTKCSQPVTVPNMILTPPPLFKGERLWRMVLSPSRRQISAEHKQPTVKDNAAARCKASLTVGCGSAMRNPATGNQQSSERILVMIIQTCRDTADNICLAVPTATHDYPVR